MMLRLVEVGGTKGAQRAVFRSEGDAAAQADRVVYERTSPDAMTFTVHFVESAAREPFVVTFTRQGDAAPAEGATPTPP